jgi:glyoxylase-like metal-dependent hydrolase (beta-lactamase superfamily II)
VFANPNRIRPDALAQSGRKARIIGIKGKGEFSDGQRRVEIYPIEASVHASGFLMVYLPNEKLLIEADAFTPGPPNAAPPATPNDNHVNLAHNIERLKLDVARILPLHGRMVPLAELYTAIGKKP